MTRNRIISLRCGWLGWPVGWLDEIYPFDLTASIFASAVFVGFQKGRWIRESRFNNTLHLDVCKYVCIAFQACHGAPGSPFGQNQGKTPCDATCLRPQTGKQVMDPLHSAYSG
jgi:hypothetical protein